MTEGLTGDTAELLALVERMDRLSDVFETASKTLSVELEALVQGQFDAQTEPYGTPWEAHKPATIERWGVHPILTLTGAMRGTLKATPEHDVVRLSVDHPARPHQTGWEGPQGWGPSRPIFPADGNLPPAWEAAVEKSLTDAVRAAMAANK